MSLCSHNLDCTFTVHIVGEKNVGKSSIINYFLCGECKSSEIAISTVRTHLIHISNHRVKLILKEQQTAPHRTDFVVIVCDVSNINTFSNIHKWTKHIPMRNDRTLVIANKSDLCMSQRAINPHQGEDRVVRAFNGRSEINNIEYIETSTKTGENIKIAFDKIIDKLIHSTARHTNFLSPVLWTKDDLLMFGFCRKYEPQNIFIPYDVIQMFLPFCFEPKSVANTKITLFENYVPAHAAAKINNEEEWLIVDDMSQTDEIDSLIHSIYVLHLCAIKGKIPKGLALSHDICIISLNIFLYSNNEWTKKMNIKSRNAIHIRFFKQLSNSAAITRKGANAVTVARKAANGATSGISERFDRGLDLLNSGYYQLRKAYNKRKGSSFRARYYYS